MAAKGQNHAKIRVITIAAILTWVVATMAANGLVDSVKIAKTGSMNGDAKFYMFMPENISIVRAVIVHQHGCGREGDGKHVPYDEQYRALCKKHDAILIGPSQKTSPNCGNWNDCNKGSKLTFLAALDTFALRTNHAEIKNAPWVLWGHSGGSRWVTCMLGEYPTRVVAVCAQSCGQDVSDVAEALKVPVMHHNGSIDLCYNDDLFSAGRSKGALWFHAIKKESTNNPNSGHGCGDLRLLANPFFDKCLTERLPEPITGQVSLKDMPTDDVWLGDKTASDYPVAAEADYSGNKLQACWFPNEAIAKMWQEYMKTKKVNDKTAPETAPTKMKGTLAGSKLTLTWEADADIESGIQYFYIYRNGTKIGQRGGEVIAWHNPTGGWQNWNYGDVPAPSGPLTMDYVDETLDAAAAYSYQVSTVNWSDLEGPKSEAFDLNGGSVTVRESVERAGIRPQAFAGAKAISIKGIIRVPQSAAAETLVLYTLKGEIAATIAIGNRRAVHLSSIKTIQTHGVVVAVFR